LGKRCETVARPVGWHSEDKAMTILTLERPVDLFVDAVDSPRVLLVEDHRMVGEMMLDALEARGADAALAPCTSAEDILAEARAYQPNVVVLDLELAAAGSGLDLIRPLVALGATVVVLSDVEDRLQVARCLEAGAVGVLSKTESFSSVLDSIRKAAANEAVTPVNARIRLLTELEQHRRESQAKIAPFEALSRREREVLSLMVQGHKAADIARMSFVSLPTVRSQIRSVLQKLGVNSQMAAVALTRHSAWDEAA
jgi:DNA-binding NarL/FixJ family response regulator